VIFDGVEVAKVDSTMTNLVNLGLPCLSWGSVTWCSRLFYSKLVDAASFLDVLMVITSVATATVTEGKVVILPFQWVI
jgi:hypothetical protein